VFGVGGLLADLYEFNRRYDKPMTEQELADLPQREFVRWAREKLWDRIANEKFQKSFDDCELDEKRIVDFEAILKIAKAMEEAKNEETPTDP
jgi:hypothetical protein